MSTPILKQSKFWIAVLDAIISIATMFVTAYLTPTNSGFVLAVIAAVQPVLILLIHGLTVEDVARINADASIKEAQAYNK